MAWLDDFIGFFSPRSKYRRLVYREATSSFEKASEIRNDWLRNYEGAARGRRTAGWKAGSTSANTEIMRDLLTLRNRSRDLVRNNPYAAKAIKLISSNIVGSGIRPKIVVRETGEGASEVQDLWLSWANGVVDYEGKLDFYGIQKLVVEAMVESGEVVIRRRFKNDGSPIPLRLQVLESDFIATNLIQTMSNGNKILQGIEYDQNSNIVAYHLYSEHPGNLVSQISFGSNFNTVRVPASEIIHMFRVDRPGQIRGVPWLAPVMLRLRDFDDYEDAQLVRQKIAACFAAFVQDSSAIDAPLTDDKKAALGEKVEPGIIEILPPGKSVTFGNPPTVENYREYTTVVLHAIATGLGVSYEALTGDLSEVNFSSARMGFLEFGRNIDCWRSSVVNTMFNSKVASWFFQSSSLLGVSQVDYDTFWIAPKREMVDPTREIPAKIKAIRAGIESLDDAIMQNGKDPFTHLNQIAETNKLIDELGLFLDSDPRKFNDDGNFQAESSEPSQGTSRKNGNGKSTMDGFSWEHEEHA